jgi:hypothetical protein
MLSNLRSILVAASAVTLPLVAAVAPASAASAAVTRPGPAAAPHSARVTWPSDWANSSFCGRFGAAYMGTTFNGVAACGQAYGTNSNEQGAISYGGVEFDSVGFQCVEVAARYFYYVTGDRPPIKGYGSDYAWVLQQAYPQFHLAPAGEYGGTNRYSSTITPGAIISMWSSSDSVPGHIAVVTSVSVNSSGNGSIGLLEENASGNGAGSISVSNGVMSFGNGYFTTFQWLYGLPSPGTPPPPPKYYPYNVAGVGSGSLHERTGPSVNDAIVGNLANGAVIDITCQTTGSVVNGSDIWDKLTNGTYVSDYYTTTPNFDTWSPPIPHPC